MAEEMKKEQETAAETQQKEDALKAKYGKIYRVGVILTPDDDTEIAKCYYFRSPSVASYDRYVKTASNNATRSLKTFLMDAVLPESAGALTADLEEYPALSISVGEKLLAMMGLSKETNLKALNSHLEAVKGSIYEAGRLEILHFVPPDCLGQADLEHMELDEFLHYLAMARYIQELESAIIQRGVVSAFPEE